MESNLEKDNIEAKKIEIISIDKIVPHPKNANRHSKEQIERLKKIIKFQKFRNPLIISKRTGFLIVGHGRLEAAKSLKFKELPVIYQDFDSEEQEYSYLISDNAIASWAELDLSMVNAEMLDLGPDFDIECLGLKEFSICPEDFDEEESDESEDENKKFVLQVELPNDMELRDLYDDLTSKGYLVREM